MIVGQTFIHQIYSVPTLYRPGTACLGIGARSVAISTTPVAETVSCILETLQPSYKVYRSCIGFIIAIGDGGGVSAKTALRTLDLESNFESLVGITFGNTLQSQIGTGTKEYV
jgi:hypothetical protein